MFARRATALALFALLLAGCRDWQPTAPELDQPLAPLRVISDASRNGGHPQFYWLPPVASGPTTPGTFDPDQSPTVQICRLSGSSCANTLATYTRSSGVGAEVVRIDTLAGHYLVNWNSSQFKLDPAVHYRITVKLGSTVLGYADVDVVKNASEEKAVNRAQYVPLVLSQTLPIKFRLEKERLRGSPTAPAATAIPDRSFDVRGEDYAAGHPELPGVPLSVRTLLLRLKPTATVADANRVLDLVKAEIAGGIPGIAGQVPGILFLRLPTATHEAMEEALAKLKADASVAGAVQDALLSPTVVTRQPAAIGEHWSWEREITTGNWGLELLRVPQMWNLNRGIQRSAPAPGTTTAILDAAFARAHEDLTYEDYRSHPDADSTEADHGTHVAGIIGARFDNGIGIDGINPFARLIVRGKRPARGNDPFHGAESFGLTLRDGLRDLLTKQPQIRVLNVSLAFNWSDYRISTTESRRARAIANEQGESVADMLRGLEKVQGRLPVIVTGTGNDSDPRSGLGPQDARYASPLANAAIVHGVQAILVVEGLTRSPGGAGGAVHAEYSNPGGDLSAPGTDIYSTSVKSSGGIMTATYEYMSGTSMAAPHVAGLASYLYALAPELEQPTTTTNLIKSLLLATAVPVDGGARPRIDAFAAALAVDSARGGDRVLRMLLDIDDGTMDGNLRVNADGSVNIQDVGGDGQINMSDFRRWRDALLSTENGADVLLDGSVRHPKKDLNGDGKWLADGVDENIYPRADFNGDGFLSRDSVRYVPGAVRASVTDLQVLQKLFSDPDVQKSELKELINSADLHIDAAQCLAVEGAVRVQVRVQRTSDPLTPLAGRDHDSATPVRIYTVPTAAGGHTAMVTALDATGQVIGSAERDFGTLPRGADVRWTPACASFTTTRVVGLSRSLQSGASGGDYSELWTNPGQDQDEDRDNTTVSNGSVTSSHSTTGSFPFMDPDGNLQTLTFSLSGTGNATLGVTPGMAGTLAALAGEVISTSSSSSTGTPPVQGSAGGSGHVRFQVLDGNVPFTLTVSCVGGQTPRYYPEVTVAYTSFTLEGPSGNVVLFGCEHTKPAGTSDAITRTGTLAPGAYSIYYNTSTRSDASGVTSQQITGKVNFSITFQP